MKSSRFIFGILQKSKYLYALAYWVNGNYWIKNNKLKNIMFYATDKCNSRCKHCFIWDKKDKKDLGVDVIKDVINSKCVNKLTTYGLEGGEFILHPEYEEILYLFKDKNYTLLSNGVMADKIIEVVKDFKIKNLNLSLDGGKEVHNKMRGVNCYDNIIRIINELKDECNIFITYTFGPWNGIEDYRHVKGICDKNKLGFGYNIYSDMCFMNTQKEIEKIWLPEGVEDDYARLYNDWFDGKLRLPCNSINFNVVIWPNGDIPLCQHKDVILGNLYEQKFDEIWQSKNTQRLHKENKWCNGCWVSYHRIFDIRFAKSLSKLKFKNKFEDLYRVSK